MPARLLTDPRVATPVPVMVHDTPATIGEDLAAIILDGIATAAAAGGRYVLGCPSGRSPRPVYQAMAARLREKPQDLSALVLVMMDEYLIGDPATGLSFPPVDAHYACRGFALREIVGPLIAALPPQWQLAPHNVWFPDPGDPAAFDRLIAEAGGVDMFLLASGAGDGHIAFNPPDSDATGLSRIVMLAEQTRIDNLKTFPDFATLAEVPRYGVSVGVGTIAKAKAAAMVLTGSDKSLAVRRILLAPAYDRDWPATIVNTIPHAMILVDRAALPPEFETAHDPS